MFYIIGGILFWRMIYINRGYCFAITIEEVYLKNRIVSKKVMSKFSNRVSSHPDENHLLGQEEASLKIRDKSKIKLYPRINI